MRGALRAGRACRRGLAMVEVVSTVVVLGIGLLLVAAATAGIRADARRAATMGGIGDVARAVGAMAYDQGRYPPAYAYGRDGASALWDPADQGAGHPDPTRGIVHFSGLLLAGGYVGDEGVFAGPAAPSGGAPRTNPGPDAADWEPGQRNDLGLPAAAASPLDRQAPRVAYAANGAIMPQARLVPSGTARHFELVSRAGGCAGVPPTGVVRLVRSHAIASPATTCLLTEWHASEADGWYTLGRGQTIRAHRPIEPFLGVTSGRSPEREPTAGVGPRFRYPDASEVLPDDASFREVLTSSGFTDVNAMGRLQPGGRAHLAMVDGSVVLRTPADSVADRLWGERFYSITGGDRVR